MKVFCDKCKHQASAYCQECADDWEKAETGENPMHYLLDETKKLELVRLDQCAFLGEKPARFQIQPLNNQYESFTSRSFQVLVQEIMRNLTASANKTCQIRNYQGNIERYNREKINCQAFIEAFDDQLKDLPKDSEIAKTLMADIGELKKRKRNAKRGIKYWQEQCHTTEREERVAQQRLFVFEPIYEQAAGKKWNK